MLGIVGEAEGFLRNIFYERPIAWVKEAREKIRDLPKTNFDLGCDFAEQGKWYDALFRFKVALYLNPNYPQARYNMGCCYFHLGKMDKAKAMFQQVLRDTPNHTDTIFMLGAIDPSALRPEQRPKQMPRELVTKFFTSIAVNYNQTEAQNQYKGGVLVAEQVRPLLAREKLVIVDLGCGSGIASIPYRAMAASIIGVDVTPAMAVQAAITQGEVKLFDQVIEADIGKDLGGAVAMESADLVLLVNVVQFIGALDTVLANTLRILKPGGLVAITTEPYNGNDGFGLVNASGRFGHTAVYVKQVAATQQLETVKETSLKLYPDSSVALFVLRKRMH